MKRTNLVDLLSLFIFKKSVRVVLFFGDDKNELILEGEPQKLKRLLENEYSDFFIYAVEYYDKYLLLTARRKDV